ncbi:MAG: signal recognition particle-docking protein FtsY [Candidatus Marsarchaeota archaeon]|jgi:fused signal recognition particle receptor|nr:signal recognition particle-docking protein FtsY [Candidatus Marsarchaeota archaeon]
MFDGLRKKFQNAVKLFSDREEKKLEENSAGDSVSGTIMDSESITIPKSPNNSEDSISGNHKDTVSNISSQDSEIVRNEITSRKTPIENAIQAPQQEKKQINSKVKIKLSTKIKGTIFNKVRLSDSEINGFAEDLKVSMLESDVSYDTTEEFISDLKKKLSTEINAKDIKSALFDSVRASLLDIMSKAHPINIMDGIEKKIKEREIPVKILFLGPNGTGKTTTIGKIGYMLKSKGISMAFSASDTFRAAAIEQTEHHANALNVPVIKSVYGADPSSVAFDAIAYATAHNIEVVLIDSAGRQETNRNLIGEIQKMARVIKPDIVIYVGESTSGNAIAEQIREFSKFIRIDGIILTKLDCDAKGGNAISITSTTGIPVLYFGIGESYKDLIPYDPKMIIDAILPN